MLGRSIPVALALVALAAPSAAAVTPSEVERRLARDPVYVEPGADPTVTPAVARALRRRIERRDPGRIRLAAISSATASTESEVERFANEVARYARGRGREVEGLLYVTGGSSGWAVYSFAAGERFVSEFREAGGERVGIAGALRIVVDVAARLDPGPGPDREERGRVPGPEDDPLKPFEDAASDVAGVAKGVLITIGATIAAVALLVVGIFAFRAARRRRAEEQVQDATTDDARRELLELGDAIRAFDLDVSMPGADPAGVAAYGAAVEHYDRARPVLDRDEPDPFEVGRARADVAEGLRQMQAARERLGP